jgi:hypothetical protein
MNLNAYVAERRTHLFERLLAGSEPDEGTFDAALFRACRDLGTPQLGSSRFTPDAIELEFIYPGPGGSTVFVVTLEAPERIVYMPVPDWVVENVWQGEVEGSFRFEREAMALLTRFQAGLDPEANGRFFERREPKRRE